MVNAHTGIVYLPEGEFEPSLDKPDWWATHHKYGTHSAPWYLAEVRPQATHALSSVEGRARGLQLGVLFGYIMVKIVK